MRTRPVAAAFHLAALSLVGCASAAPLHQPLITDRPDYTESVDVVPAGHAQAEGGYTLTRTDGATQRTFGELLVRVGVSDRAELRADLGSYATGDGVGGSYQGFDDVGVGAKIRLADGGGARSARPAVSLLVGTTVPSGARALRAPHAAPEVKLATDWTLHDGWSLTTNAVYALEPGDAPAGTPWLSASLGHDLTDQFSAYVEGYAHGSDAAHRGTTAVVNGGFAYRITDDLQLDVRSGSRAYASIGPVRGSYFFGAGLAARW
ncbi:MAG TPA: transporter [Gemmatimonadaceae bacterium]